MLETNHVLHKSHHHWYFCGFSQSSGGREGVPLKQGFFLLPTPLSLPPGESSGALTLSIKSLCVKSVSDGIMAHPMHQVHLSWNNDRPWIDPRQCNYWNQKGNNIKSERVRQLRLFGTSTSFDYLSL